jgi:hypothetical protein
VPCTKTVFNNEVKPLADSLLVTPVQNLNFIRRVAGVVRRSEVVVRSLMLHNGAVVAFYLGKVYCMCYKRRLTYRPVMLSCCIPFLLPAAET